MPAFNIQEQMVRSMFQETVVQRRKYTKPCKILENVGTEYVESNYAKNTTQFILGEFWFGIYFRLSSLKEITQVR
jgi:hypothetical protein